MYVKFTETLCIVLPYQAILCQIVCPGDESDDDDDDRPFPPSIVNRTVGFLRTLIKTGKSICQLRLHCAALFLDYLYKFFSDITEGSSATHLPGGVQISAYKKFH